MKVEVTEIFRDVYTNEIYSKGKELTVDNKRYQQIKDFVKVIKKTRKK